MERPSSLKTGAISTDAASNCATGATHCRENMAVMPATLERFPFMLDRTRMM